MGKMVPDFFLVCLQFSLFNKLKNKTIQGKPLKYFGVAVNIFWGPAKSEKATLQHEISELGSYNNLAQHRKSSIFFKSLPP